MKPAGCLATRSTSPRCHRRRHRRRHCHPRAVPSATTSACRRRAWRRVPVSRDKPDHFVRHRPRRLRRVDAVHVVPELGHTRRIERLVGGVAPRVVGARDGLLAPRGGRAAGWTQQRPQGKHLEQISLQRPVVWCFRRPQTKRSGERRIRVSISAEPTESRHWQHVGER